MAADPPRRPNAAHATGAMQVEHCDIPAGMTIGEWRAAAAEERRAARAARRAAQRGVRGALRRALRRR
jgi:hypothetical protein